MNKSFKERVNDFWKHFEKEEASIRELMDAKAESNKLIDRVNEVLSVAFNNAYFELGQNEENKYELILTPEGDHSKLLPLQYWLEAAPEKLKQTWNFYSSKPGKAGDSFELRMYDTSVSLKDVQIYTTIDEQAQKINLQVYSPNLMKLEENQRYSMLLIFLDQFIGEIYSMEYVGLIDFIEKPFEVEGISAVQLKKEIDAAIAKYEWFNPDNIAEKCTGYQMEPSKAKDWQLREDIYIGYSSCFPVLNAFYNHDSELFETFKADGIFSGFLFYKNVDVPDDKMVPLRSEIEDKILAMAKPQGIADTIGGGTGFYFSYMDFIIYDMDAFMKVAKEVLKEYKHLGQIGFSDFIYGIEPQMLY